MPFNYIDRNFDFLKKKINEIKIALFKTELNPQLQLPNNIIQTYKVEDDGTVWFFTSFNGKQYKNINRPFYAYLSYYKKETGCHLQVSGSATIIENEDNGLFSMNNYPKGYYGRLVLVKMKILQAKFYENKVLENTSWTEKFKNTFNHLFLQPAHRSYNFSE